MHLKRYYNGYTMLEILCSLSIHLILISTLMHFIFVLNTSIFKHYRKIDYQQALLVANHYLGMDIRNAGFRQREAATVCKANDIDCAGKLYESIYEHIYNRDIKADSDILILHTVTDQDTFNPSIMSYYLRKSIISDINHMRSYTLYRDEEQHPAQALIEGITDWQVHIDSSQPHQIVSITLEFKDAAPSELIFVPRNPSTAL